MDRNELKNMALNLLKSNFNGEGSKDTLINCIEELELLDHLTTEEKNLIDYLKDKLNRINLNDSANRLLKTLENTSKNALVNPSIRDDLNYHIRMLEILEKPTENELKLLSSLRKQLEIDNNRPLDECMRFELENDER